MWKLSLTFIMRLRPVIHLKSFAVAPLLVLKKNLNLINLGTSKQLFVKTETIYEKRTLQTYIVKYRAMKQVTIAQGEFVGRPVKCWNMMRRPFSRMHKSKCWGFAEYFYEILCVSLSHGPGAIRLFSYKPSTRMVVGCYEAISQTDWRTLQVDC